MLFSRDTAGTPSTMTDTSKLVPPMSQVMRLGRPAATPMRAAAIAPDAGPDMTVCTACRDASGASIMPPLPCMMRSSRAKPPSRSRCEQASDVAADQRLHVRVQRGDRAALELADLRQQLGAERHVVVRPQVAHDREAALLVVRDSRTSA